MKNEIYNLQIIRGIAASLVVFSHLIPNYTILFANAGEFGVGMFFFLSGLLMVETFKEDESAFTFIKKRILRIYPTYLLISAPLIIWWLLENKSLSYLLHNISLIPWAEWDRNSPPVDAHDPLANPVCWTLCYEMYFYVIFSLCKGIFKKRKNTTVSCILSISLLLIASRFFFTNSNKLGFYSVSVPEVSGNLIILNFCAGMFASLLFKEKETKPINLSILLLIPISMLSEKTVSHFGFNWNVQLTNFLTIAIPSIIVSFAMYRSNHLKGDLFCKIHSIGAYSYSLYLMHSYFLLLTVFVLRNESKLAQAVYSIILIFLSFYISNKLYTFIEKPISKKFKRSKREVNLIT